MTEKKHNYFYKITNKINGKFYYGIHSTNNLDDGYMGSGCALQKAIKKYGIENFEKQIIADYSTRKEVINKEKEIVTFELIQTVECYNINVGGSRLYSSIPSEITKQRMRESHKGYIPPTKGLTLDEYHGTEIANSIKLKMAESQMGKKHSNDTKQKMSEWQIGKTLSDKTIQKIKETKKLRKDDYKTITSDRLERNHGAWMTEETKKKIRENYCNKRSCIIEGILFETMKSACEHFKISKLTLKNRIKSAHNNWINWNYAADNL